MKRYQKLVESGSVSDLDTGRSSSSSSFNFEFPRAISPAVPNDVVFCGKVITRQSGPGPELHRSESSANLNSGRTNGFTAMLRSPSGRASRCRRSDSSRKRYNGMFGTVKFPLQMDLSDIKMRQERREPMAPPKFPLEEGGASSGGGQSCWELVRPLRRRGTLMSALAKASFGCLRIV